MIKAIVFDWGGVFTKGSFRNFCQEYGKSLYKSEMEIEGFIKVVYTTWDKAKVDQIEAHVFWETIANYVGKDVDEFKKMFMDSFPVNEEMLAIAKRLKKNGYKLGLLTNQIEDWMLEVIAINNLDRIFDLIATSYSIGLSKPDLGVYENIVEQLMVEPKECVFIDDHMKNMPPAKKLGMQTILFENVKQMKEELWDLGIEI